MKSRNETGFEQLPSDLMLRINQLCDRYESQLRLGELPSIDDYLEHIAVEYRDVILRELIPLEMEHRCQLGESPDANEYLELYPGLDPGWLASSLKTTQTELLTATGISARARPAGAVSTADCERGHSLAGRIDETSGSVCSRSRLSDV